MDVSKEKIRAKIGDTIKLKVKANEELKEIRNKKFI